MSPKTLHFFIVLQFIFSAKSNQINLSNNTSVLYIRDYPNSLPGQKIKTWNITSPKNTQILIRKHYILLFPGDELSMIDDLTESRAVLAKYTIWSSSTRKMVSSGEKVSVELKRSLNITLPSLGSDSQIFSFNFTFELFGFCEPNTSASSDRVSCGNSQNLRCYSASEDRCDGVWDCPLSGVDEMGCSCPSPSEFACADFASSGACYKHEQRCDGFNHCGDRSDEMNCPESQCSIGADRFLCLSPTPHSLKDTQSRTGECIALSRLCDDHADCANGADEAADLCQFSTNTSADTPADTTERGSYVAAVARRFASHVAHEVVESLAAAAGARIESRLRSTLTYVLSALLGPMLIVLTVGLMCKAPPAAAGGSGSGDRRSLEEARRARQQARYNSPIQRLVREELRSRPPPPTYEEALTNSLFEEPLLEGVAPPPPPPLPPGALPPHRVAAVRALSAKPPPLRLDAAVSCNLLPVPHPPFRPSNEDDLDSSSSSSSSGNASSDLQHQHQPSLSQLQREESSGVGGGGGFGRWLVGTLNSWRRGGGGGTSGSASGASAAAASYEQPDVSETTVVSSIPEEEEVAVVVVGTQADDVSRDVSSPNAQTSPTTTIVPGEVATEPEVDSNSGTRRGLRTPLLQRSSPSPRTRSPSPRGTNA